MAAQMTNHPAWALFQRYAAVGKAAWQHRHELAGPARLSDELAFLPAHLSLQDTPVHPAPRRAGIALCALFTAALVWSVLGKIDIVAVANGRVIVHQRSKTVQPLDTSVVKAIHVKDGDQVQAGQLLIELDPTNALADASRVDQERASAYSESLRTQLLLSALSATPVLAPTWPAQHELAPDDAALAKAQLQTEWDDISAKLAKLQAELETRVAEMDTAQQQVAKLQTTLPLAIQREADFKALSAQGFVAGHAGQDRTRERIELERDLATAQARTRETRAAQLESQQARLAYRAETLRNLRERHGEAELKLHQSDEERHKASQRTALTRLTAPVSGSVQQLAVHTVGGVVTPAQVLLVVVPNDAQVSAEVKLENKDIGFVREGQLAEVKFETFPFTRYGTVPATVTTVSADAVLEDKRSTASTSTTATTEDTTSVASFPALLTLQASTLNIDGKTVRLTPGMNVTAEIKTGKRRVIDYLISPIRQRISESAGER
ncbi:HlyD family type I secretion periplasmic adaptor subunit [Ideonella azotifigens]|uniref:Membrane fusion protein (MFP) family protein n=1 Tax=Ideonella azotifigens TaxID=513160 RepID=A0ABN1K5C2_9BURK|nr:HlyD family type I secretion periplasmic adaptor subunit [Ideonella azotifigens]MCD2342365.1 HlyD family type I secretion periplasmic adaptor subunit [Ideonella azotifigens]